jgi:hypothetical protein
MGCIRHCAILESNAGTVSWDRFDFLFDLTPGAWVCVPRKVFVVDHFGGFLFFGKGLCDVGFGWAVGMLHF